MAEEDIRKFINSRPTANAPTQQPRMVVRRAPSRSAPKEKRESTYANFNATHLFCPTCRQATPVREKLLLYLADGDLYGYLCSVCGTSVGTRKAGQDFEPG